MDGEVKRGRPRRTLEQIVDAPAPVVGTEQPRQTAPQEAHAEAVQPSRRRKRGSVGGFGAKLAAPTREGYVRRFVNDDRNRIAQMQDLGYTVVQEDGVQSFDAGSAITRLAGTKEGGEPLRTILMETPVELYEQGRSEMETENAVTDKAILSGRDEHGGLTDRETYRPDGHKNSIQVER